MIEKKENELTDEQLDQVSGGISLINCNGAANVRKTCAELRFRNDQGGVADYYENDEL